MSVDRTCHTIFIVVVVEWWPFWILSLFLVSYHFDLLYVLDRTFFERASSFEAFIKWPMLHFGEMWSLYINHLLLCSVVYVQCLEEGVSHLEKMLSTRQPTTVPSRVSSDDTLQLFSRGGSRLRLPGGYPLSLKLTGWVAHTLAVISSCLHSLGCGFTVELVVVVVVVVTFSLCVRIVGECLTTHSPPALFFSGN